MFPVLSLILEIASDKGRTRKSETSLWPRSLEESQMMSNFTVSRGGKDITCMVTSPFSHDNEKKRHRNAFGDVALRELCKLIPCIYIGVVDISDNRWAANSSPERAFISTSSTVWNSPSETPSR
jgi:hypothetical protein